MGKASIFVVLAVMLGGNSLLFDAQQTSVETDEKQSERQGQILAREMARSGHNMALSKARQLQIQYPDMPLEDIVDLVNGDQGYISGEYEDGTYEAQVYLTSSSSFAVNAVGIFTINEHEVRSEQLEEGILGEEILEVTEPGTATVEVTESSSGYCSAIFIQRLTPKNNNGHGNNVDNCDVSNPGEDSCFDTDPTVDDEIQFSRGGWNFLQPQLLLPPDNNRDGELAMYDTVLEPGTMINLILAVDADYDCEKRGDTTVTITDSMFDYQRSALLADVEDLEELMEGDYAMIQESRYTPGVWRVAFEDLTFDKHKLNDVKRNGYGTTEWSSRDKTYGGSGWSGTDYYGYWPLQNFGHMPDFSDQVIEIRLSSGS